MRHNAIPKKDDGKDSGELWVGWCLTGFASLLIGLMVALLLIGGDLDRKLIAKILLLAPLGLALGIYFIKRNREVRP